jgi:hypothetical protein
MPAIVCITPQSGAQRRAVRKDLLDRANTPNREGSRYWQICQTCARRCRSLDVRQRRGQGLSDFADVSVRSFGDGISSADLKSAKLLLDELG